VEVLGGRHVKVREGISIGLPVAGVEGDQVAGVDESVEPPPALLALGGGGLSVSCVAEAATQPLSQAVDDVTGSKTRSNQQETNSRRSGTPSLNGTSRPSISQLSPVDVGNSAAR
jgi:hypothetical protein